MRRAVFLLLVFLAVVVLLVRLGSFATTKLFQSASNGGIKVTTIPNAQVFINDQAAGTTPFTNEALKIGEYKVRVGTGSATWQGQVKVTQGTLTVVNRELAASEASASGEILVLSPGEGAVVTSTPSGSDLEVDGKSVGKTPVAVSSLTAGDHTFTLSHDGYLKRSIRAFVPDKLQLNLDVDLAISEVDLSTVAAPPVQVSQQYVVRSTPTGFLRVRDKAGLDGKEVGRLNVGDTVSLIEESNGWMKVSLPTGQQGFVSSQYLVKKTQ